MGCAQCELGKPHTQVPHLARGNGVPIDDTQLDSNDSDASLVCSGRFAVLSNPSKCQGEPMVELRIMAELLFVLGASTRVSRGYVGPLT